ncbi:MAG: RsmE family RNA methyltransferase [Isosphaeraceae bacterium]
MPARFFCPDPPHDGRWFLNADESRHLTRVCRLGVGDRVEIFDGRGSVALGQILAVSSASVELGVDEGWLAEVPTPVSLTLATAVPKGDRFDWLIEKATEIGVERLVPLITDRSVVAPRGSKLDRLRRSIIEASKQCRRARLMLLDDPMEWTDLLGAFPGSMRFLADPQGNPPQHWATIPRGGSVVLAVGPEGGFSSSEFDLARDSGWLAIRFSSHMLRIETAGLAGCAALLSRVPEADE